MNPRDPTLSLDDPRKSDLRKRMSTQDYDSQAELALKAAPLPTPTMLKRRRNVFIQLWRLIAINIKMIRVIWASHHIK